MKKRLLAILTLFALLLSPAALASQALGWELVRTDTVLGPGVTMTTQTFWGDSKQDYRAERYVTYTPGQGSAPVVCYGATVPSRATVIAMAKDLEGYGHRVLAGANADYFVMASGVPLGMVVTYGVLRSSSSYEYAVGFKADGSAFVGQPSLKLMAAFHSYDLALSGGYNKSRTPQGGYFLYSSDFGATTQASGDGVNVVLRPVSVPEDYIAPEKPAPFVPPSPSPTPAQSAAALSGATGDSPDPTEADETPADAQETPTSGDAPSADAQETPTGEDGTDENADETAADLSAEPTPSPEELAWQAEMDQWRWDLATSVADFETLNAQLTIGGELTCVVESVSRASGAVSIPEGRFVLSMDARGDSFLLGELSTLELGEQLTLSVTSADPRWSDAVSALGAYQWILQNGALPAGLDAAAAPRTALGIKPNGDVLLYTIDGRRPGHSVGASVKQVAQRLLELGCDQAVLFDGGGSTTFGATGALDWSFALQNRPSDGSQRAVTNALFFVNELSPTGELGSLYVEPQSALLLSGAKLPLSVRTIDSGFYPLEGQSISNVTYTAEGPGWVAGSTFQAGTEQGTALVTASAGKDVTGTALMRVIATPHTISVTDVAGGGRVKSLNLDPGQTVSLDASATWYKLPLLADDSCFTWTVEGNVGTVDLAGNLTAAYQAGSGALTVTAGEKTVSIPITIGGHVYTLEDFERSDGGFTGDGAASCALSGQQVRYGKQSLRVDYPVDRPSALTCNVPIAAGESWLSCWLWGDGSPLALEAQLLRADGSQSAVQLTAEAVTGWQQLQVPIPEDAAALTGLTVTPAEGSTGTFYLDHLTSANAPIQDLTPPTAKVAVQDSIFTAKLSDNVDKTFDAQRITLTLDGWKIPFDLSGNTLTAPVYLADGLYHRLSLTVTDASGNLKRATAEVAAQSAPVPPFADIDGHWAQDYITYLAYQGVTNGRVVDGVSLFDPQTNITRAEFAAMLARWQRADLTGYEGAALPFVDAGAIPEWARLAVAYLYDAGVMTGSLEADGLYANANDPITRAQAMTMLGRVQAKGAVLEQGTLFVDHDLIPAWAQEYVYALTAQGVVSGYEGYVRPQDPISRCEVAKLLTMLW